MLRLTVSRQEAKVAHPEPHTWLCHNISQGQTWTHCHRQLLLLLLLQCLQLLLQTWQLLLLLQLIRVGQPLRLCWLQVLLLQQFCWPCCPCQQLAAVADRHDSVDSALQLSQQEATVAAAA
jgi:hypothetical protein